MEVGIAFVDIAFGRCLPFIEYVIVRLRRCLQGMNGLISKSGGEDKEHQDNQLREVMV